MNFIKTLKVLLLIVRLATSSLNEITNLVIRAKGDHLWKLSTPETPTVVSVLKLLLDCNVST